METQTFLSQHASILWESLFPCYLPKPWRFESYHRRNFRCLVTLLLLVGDFHFSHWIITFYLGGVKSPEPSSLDLGGSSVVEADSFECFVLHDPAVGLFIFPSDATDLSRTFSSSDSSELLSYY